MEKRMGRNPRIGGHKIRNRGKRKRKLRERTEEAGEKDGAPRICKGEGSCAIRKTGPGHLSARQI